MVFRVPFDVSGIEADTREEALEMAKNRVKLGTQIGFPADKLIDHGHLEFDRCTNIRLM